MRPQKKLPEWNKSVKIAMIQRDLTIPDVALKMKWTRQYTSAIINGRVYHKEAVVKISFYLGIEVPEDNSTLVKKLVK